MVAMAGSRFVVFCNIFCFISKHQKEIASGKSAKTLHGRSENVRGCKPGPCFGCKVEVLGAEGCILIRSRDRG